MPCSQAEYTEMFVSAVGVLEICSLTWSCLMLSKFHWRFRPKSRSHKPRPWGMELLGARS